MQKYFIGILIVAAVLLGGRSFAAQNAASDPTVMLRRRRRGGRGDSVFGGGYIASDKVSLLMEQLRILLLALLLMPGLAWAQKETATPTSTIHATPTATPTVGPTATPIATPLAASRANTSQKGSLLIWPEINVDPENSSNTLIELSNDQNSAVHIECYYVNELKDRVDFDFDLTGHATASWDVLTGSGTIAPPVFPSGGTFTGFGGNPNRGELVCFAVDFANSNQIAFNHLTGTATLVEANDADATQTKQAFRYNAWSFTARGATGPAADRTQQGTPGDLVLSGNGAGTYDACPLYNIAEFSPNGSTLDGVTTIDNDIAFVSCNQDLRQDFKIHLTKVLFTDWNAFESSFTGSYRCIDSVQFVPLSSADQGTPPFQGITNVTNFDFRVLRTPNASLRAQGIASTQCPFSENAGLLGVLNSSVAIAPDTGEDAELGSNTYGAGAESGFVLWDPRGPTPFGPKRR
jgi:hypothetical protein